jgi:hypothetical protein
MQGGERAECSASDSGAWLGASTAPEPRRIAEVDAAACAVSTAGGNAPVASE